MLIKSLSSLIRILQSKEKKWSEIKRFQTTERYNAVLRWNSTAWNLWWARLRWPEKIVGLTLSLDFFDRCAINQFACSATGSAHWFIPTRRIISVSKLFCLENVIRGGFIWYQLYSSYGLYGFLLSKIYHRRISQVTLEGVVRLVCMYYRIFQANYQHGR